MSISSVSSQANNLYQQLQLTPSFTAVSPGTRSPGQTGSTGNSADDNDGSSGAASALSASIGQIIDSYA